MMFQRALSSRLSVWLLEKTVAEPVQGRLLDSVSHPATAQERILADLIARGAATAYGQEHGFSEIRCADDFQCAVPVVSYEELQPYVERAFLGREPDVLWPGTPSWFVESSGTTGERKRLPVTQDGWSRVYLDTAKTYVIALNQRLKPRSLLRGKSIFFPGKVHRAEHDRDVLVGDITALSVHLTPWYLDFARAPDKATTIDPDRNWEERLHRIAAATVDQNIVHLAGLPTWLVHFGRIVLQMSGAATLRQVWPNLMAVTLGGVNPGPYLAAIDALIGAGDGDPLVYSEVYNGTEGFYAMQIDGGDMVLLPNGGLYYEFVARNDVVTGNLGAALRLDEVVAGVEYAPVISTYNGLWRYLIGDTVRFTSTQPYRLHVTGRVSQYLNTAGEELLVANVDAAMQAACDVLGVSLVDYTGAPLQPRSKDALPRHLWVVALAEPYAVDGDAFARALDQALISNHFDYAKMRNAGIYGEGAFGLDSPIALLTPPDSFMLWLNQRPAGGAGGQSKVPRLSQDTRIVAQVLGILEPEALARAFHSYPVLRTDEHLARLEM
ncbi:MAG: GH3 auxin-responsive promoter family protein [Caldilineaceae bacterium]